MELKKTILDRMVHLLSHDCVLPVVSYIRKSYEKGDTDISLIRHFVTEVGFVLTQNVTALHACNNVSPSVWKFPLCSTILLKASLSTTFLWELCCLRQFHGNLTKQIFLPLIFTHYVHN